MIIKQNLMISITFYAVIMFILVCILLCLLSYFYSDNKIVSDDINNSFTKSSSDQFKTAYFFILAFLFVSFLIIIFMNLHYMYINYIPIPLRRHMYIK
jgi:Ca2+/Na+ antiporter